MPNSYRRAAVAKLPYVDIGGAGNVPASLWRRIRSEPERAPEHIALGAAERFAPQAARWVQVAGPGQTADSLAKTALKKHVRMSRLERDEVGWIQSRMVFYIAAAYGYDPADPMRPA